MYFLGYRVSRVSNAGQPHGAPNIIFSPLTRPWRIPQACNFLYARRILSFTWSSIDESVVVQPWSSSGSMITEEWLSGVVYAPIKRGT